MSNHIFRRSILYNRQHAKKVLNVHQQDAIRNVTVAAVTDKYEDPALATAKPFDEIPKVPMLPFIGSAWTFFPIIGRYNLRMVHKADIHKRKVYGDIVRERFGNLNLVNSFTPESMEIFARHEGKYPVRADFNVFRVYRESRRHWYKNLGLMLLNGEEWEDLRKKTQKHLMKPKAIQAYLGPMQDVAKDFVTLIDLKKDANNEVPDLLGQLYRWSLESITFVGLDARLDCLNPNLVADSDGMKIINSLQTQFECINKLEPLLGNFPFWKYLPSPKWKKFVQASDTFAEIAFKYINLSLADLKKRKDDDADLTLLQSMLMTKGLDVSDTMVILADMLMAGIESTSNSMGFFFYAMAKNPEKQELLFKEIHELLPGKEDRITPQIFHNLRYVKACLKEAIRMYPVARGNVRTFDHDVVLSGYRIPAKTTILSIFQVMYRDERYFKNADKFLPERWLSKEEKPENPYAFVPFGVGVRSCIGRRLAELEMISLATEVIRNFKIEYHHEDIGMITRMANIPDKPLRFNFLHR